jgi:release factor glutamine methyltransferase
MRIPSNKLSALREFFFSELHGIYPEAEIGAMFDEAALHVLGYSRTEVLIKADENVNQSDLLVLYDCAKDLRKHIPLQYILGETFFCGLRFVVNKSVLIPRPETEELVELLKMENPRAGSILDVGTGSGCIAISLKRNFETADVWACDVSDTAIDVALQNSHFNDAPVNFVQANALDLSEMRSKLNGPFDIVISNPPYIKNDESAGMSPNVKDHEPHLALFVDGNDAIIFYKRIVDFCKEGLSPSGALYLELNPLTAHDVQTYAATAGMFREIKIEKDMSGKERFLVARKNPDVPSFP